MPPIRTVVPDIPPGARTRWAVLRPGAIAAATLTLASLLALGLALASDEGAARDVGRWTLFSTAILCAVVHQRVRSLTAAGPEAARSDQVVSPLRLASTGVVVSVFVSAMTSIFTVASLRPVVSHSERLETARLADALAAPVCVLSPFNQWGVFVMGLLAVSAADGSTGRLFAEVMVLNLYSWCVLAVVAVSVAMTRRSRMHPPTVARVQRLPDVPGAVFAVGLAAVAVAVVSGLSSDRLLVLLAGVFWTVTLIRLRTADARHRDNMRASLVRDRAYLRAAVGGAAMLALAFAVQALAENQDMGAWMPAYGPEAGAATVFLLAAAMSLATGSSWLTMAVCLPLLGGVGAPPLSLAAAVSGAVLGDHAAPHSDTTILSAGAFGLSPLEHVLHQSGWVLLAALVSLLGFAWLGL